jgi:hypothetical protein
MSRIGHFRACGRRRVDLPALMRRRSSAELFSVRIEDLSLLGACVELGRPLPPGTPISVEIVSPTLWDPLVLHGKVVWTQLPGTGHARAGIRFVTDDTPRLFALFDLLQTLDYGD